MPGRYYCVFDYRSIQITRPSKQTEQVRRDYASPVFDALCHIIAIHYCDMQALNCTLPIKSRKNIFDMKHDVLSQYKRNTICSPCPKITNDHSKCAKNLYISNTILLRNETELVKIARFGKHAFSCPRVDAFTLLHDINCCACKHSRAGREVNT